LKWLNKFFCGKRADWGRQAGRQAGGCSCEVLFVCSSEAAWEPTFAE
jgi:hypothetical protein